MQQAQHSLLENIQVEFMDVWYQVHQQETAHNKKSKARKRYEARRAIEEHQKKRLKERFSDWWHDMDC